MKQLLKPVLELTGLALVVLVLAGCAGGSNRTAGSGSPTDGGGKPLDHVRFRMSWLISAEYAGIIAAAQNGIYKKHGIDCDIEPGGVGFPPAKLVGSGADDFGLIGGDTLLMARSQGVPIRAFATEFQETPQVFFARKSSGITQPSQFPGHVVGIKRGKTAETLYRALMGKAHVDPASVTEVDVKAGMQPFYAGTVDIWPGFIFDEAADAQAHGIPINIVRPSDYGIDLYSDVIFATDQTLKEKPDLTSRFLQATQEGWEWASAHPDSALKMVLSSYHGLDPAHEKVRLLGALPLIVGSSSHPVRPIGKMQASTWQAMYQMLDGQRLLPHGFPVTDAYTLDFVKGK